MCRKIITHHMHHDVASPMIIDSISSNPAIFANPLHTNFHRCELQFPPPGWTRDWTECSYHSCCIPHVRDEYCAAVLAKMDQHNNDYDEEYYDEDAEENYDDNAIGDDSYYDPEPEECDGFVLEHQHIELRYFGECPELPRLQYGSGAALVDPATWRGLYRIEGELQQAKHFPGFNHSSADAARWQEVTYAECEKLYTLETDAAVLRAALKDLGVYGPADARDCVSRARAKILDAEEQLQAQRRLVHDLYQWAMGPCNVCDSK
jgi:hypothetical protein